MAAVQRALVAAARTPYIDSWYHRTLKEKELALPALDGNQDDADVCVVGAGLAGVCFAINDVRFFK